jgi:hypothetical protein
VLVGSFSNETILVGNFGGTILGIDGVGFDVDQDGSPDVLTIDASGDNIPDFSVTSAAVFQVPPDAVGSVTIQCSPSEAESLTSELIIESSDPSDRFSIVTLSCVGTAP